MTSPAAPNPDGIMARLKAGTAAQHAVAESKPLEAALIEGSIGQAQYEKYLSQRWLIHRELEAATDRALRTDNRLTSLGLPSLYQTKNLEADLAHLQSNLESIRPLPGSTNLIQEIQKLHQLPLWESTMYLKAAKTEPAIFQNRWPKLAKRLFATSIPTGNSRDRSG